MKNRIRNEAKLQNFTPSIMRLAFYKDSYPNRSFQNYKEKEFESLFTEAIEDLKTGYYINGSCAKNCIEYWQKQLIELKEVANKCKAN